MTIANEMLNQVKEAITEKAKNEAIDQAFSFAEKTEIALVNNELSLVALYSDDSFFAVEIFGKAVHCGAASNSKQIIVH